MMAKVVVVVKISMSDDVLGQVEVVDRHPAGVDHVDEHQRVVAGEVDVDVVRGVVGAVPGQLGALPPDLQGVAVGEGHLRHRPGRVAVAQQPPGLLVPDADHVPAEQEGRASVVGVVVGVDQVGHRVVTADQPLPGRILRATPAADMPVIAPSPPGIRSG
jgi:hypothetical protein